MDTMYLRAINLTENECHNADKRWFSSDNEMHQYLAGQRGAYAKVNNDVVDSEGVNIGMWYYITLSTSNFYLNNERKWAKRSEVPGRFHRGPIEATEEELENDEHKNLTENERMSQASNLIDSLTTQLEQANDKLAEALGKNNPVVTGDDSNLVWEDLVFGSEARIQEEWDEFDDKYLSDLQAAGGFANEDHNAYGSLKDILATALAMGDPRAIDNLHRDVLNGWTPPDLISSRPGDDYYSYRHHQKLINRARNQFVNAFNYWKV